MANVIGSHLADTCKIYMVAEKTVLPAARADFSARDFGPEFATG